ncbi:MAG: arylesterase [Betaproteobacteria bacterium]|nr:arylesterase [Betaproteobacteria bacterium]NBS47409.1 arylesterase [Betaproteobacteria bacterium]
MDGPQTRRRHCIALAAAFAVVGLSAVTAHAADAQASAARERVILVVGDSLSAEYGLRRGSGWVALLEQRLATERIAARVVNASISGDTTSGGRSRLDALLAQHKPTHLLIELGGNDALRGLPLSMTRDNLAYMARQGKAAGARVVLIGMQVPPNYGAGYTRDFAQGFRDVAAQTGAALVPFLLKDIADGPDAQRWFQADRIHPNESAHPRMLDNVWPVLRKLL